ncbi:AAA family ATPase [Mucilaginibacter myungsuensis]|uniref:AAA family ATPase n=1 Tax=Mucilaginibacter myungsuensis TaxID=649104 RepID=A0A929PXX2_9SPHI|nr:ATP-binding protein [Mucilaginibacter myungsuensis]MBE9662722.1 AAA family ATPase [Mucilaginibacter myungsuensis]MDN3598142.1 ATP-binding protein [Mucilaginibacter myungsuensis]
MSTKSKRLRIYLDKAHLKGFKSIDDLTIVFQKGLNVLIGKNGSGKSNLIELLHKAISYKKDNRLNYTSADLKFVSEDNHLFELEIKKQTHSSLELDGENIDATRGYIERFKIDGAIFSDTNAPRNSGRFKFGNQEVTFWYNYRLTLSQLGYETIYSTCIQFDLPTNLEIVNTASTIKVDLKEGIMEDGDPYSFIFVNQSMFDLQIFFAQLKGGYENVSSQDILSWLTIDSGVIDNLKRHSPITNLRFNPNINIYNDGNTLILENIKIDFQINDTWLPWSYLSDGTRRLFYIISQVTSSNGLVLLEEPELGIHPHQFNLLMDFLKEQSEEKQIIISTHSPKALDHLSSDELNNILITYYDRQLGTQIRHLSDAEISKAKRYMKEVGFFSDYWLMSDLEE